MGGTEVISALKAVLKNTSCPTQVLLLTDGQVWHLDETLELIERTRRESSQPIRFSCLGIGDMISQALVEGVAESGRGHSDVIYFQDRHVGWGVGGGEADCHARIHFGRSHEPDPCPFERGAQARTCIAVSWHYLQT